MKKVIKYILYLFLGLLLAILILPFVFKEELKDGLRQALNENLNAEITFSDVGLNFWRDFPNAHLNVENLNIRGIDTFHQINLFKASEIKLEIGLLSLLKKSTPYSVRSLSIDSAQMNLIALQDGQVNYLITKPSSDTTAYNIDLDSYSITNSELHYKDLETDLSIDLYEVNHSGSGNLTEEIYDLETYSESPDFNLSFAGVPYISKASIKADAIISVDLNDEKYTFQDNNIILNAFPFRIDGYTKIFPESIEMDLNLIAEQTDFSKLYSLVPMAFTSDFQSAKITGDGNISAFVKGRYSNDEKIFPEYSLKGIVNNGNIQYDRLPYPISNINTDFEITNVGQKNDNIQIRVPSFGFQVQDDYVKGYFNSIGPIDNPYIDMNLDAEFDLSNWKNSFPLASSSILKGNGKIDLVLQTDLKSIRDNRLDKVRFNSNSHIQNLDFKLENLQELKADKISVKGDSKRLEAIGQNLVYGDSDFSFEILLENPLLVMIDKTMVKGKAILNSKRINLNSLYAQSTDSDTIEDNADKGLMLFGEFDLEANINEMVFEDKLYRYNGFKGRLIQDNFNIISATTQVADSDIKASGYLSNINNYLNQSGVIQGEIIISSGNFNVDPWLVESDNPKDSSFSLPPNTEIDLQIEIGDLLYKGMKMKNIQASGSLFNQSIQISHASSEALGGSFSFEGLFATPENAPPLFDFKLDLQSILFQEAFQQLNTFRAIAPIAKFISGQFNTTLIMAGSINDQMLPVWNELDASGFIETLDGKLSGFEPASKLATKLGIEKLKQWNIGNTRNWFEIMDGMVQLKENTFNLGDGISLTVGGKHGIGKTMDYDIYLEIPRILLQENEITSAMDKGLIFLENEAGKLGINLDQGENILIKIDLTGTLAAPDIQIKPMGTTGKSVSSELEDQIQQEKEKISQKIAEGKENIIDSIQQRKNQAVDSLTSEISQKSKSALDSLKSKANSKLDSLINKTLADSTSSTLEDLLKQKTKKEEDKMKDVLNKWSPFKKKTSKDTSTIKSQKS